MLISLYCLTNIWKQNVFHGIAFMLYEKTNKFVIVERANQKTGWDLYYQLVPQTNW